MLLWHLYISLLFSYRDYICKKNNIIGLHCASCLIFNKYILASSVICFKYQNVLYLVKYKTTGTMPPNDVNFFLDVVPIKKQQTYIRIPKYHIIMILFFADFENKQVTEPILDLMFRESHFVFHSLSNFDIAINIRYWVVKKDAFVNRQSFSSKNKKV